MVFPLMLLILIVGPGINEGGIKHMNDVGVVQAAKDAWDHRDPVDYDALLAEKR